MILQTPDGVFVGDEIDIATQLLNKLVLPIDKRRLQHLAVAMTGCDISEVHFDNVE